MTKKKKKKESWKEKRRQAAIKHQKALEAERLKRERQPKKSKGWSRSKALAIAFLSLTFLLIGVYAVWQRYGVVDEKSLNIVLLKTSMGDIKIELYDDKPITTGNFKKLVEDGIYDGTTFHRVIDGFMIQGGIPAGNQSVSAILDEIEDHNKNERGTVAMANTGNPNTGTSQFFINLVYNEHLDTGHIVFGKVIEGMDIVDAIAKVETGPENKPIQDVKITKAELIK